jgi:2,3,4,5-tetrahydropyridine-2-carboxylate N-succinyltransferase
LTTSPGEHENASHLRWAAALEQRFLLLNDRDQPQILATSQAAALLRELCDALEAGALRMAQRDARGIWQANSWLKGAIMLLGSVGPVEAQPGPLPGSELSGLGWSDVRPLDRRVPAGSFVRRGVCLRPGCTVMPPSTLQVGAYVAESVRVDSHALVGSAVQLLPRAQVGCGTMLGGLLLPEQALPVIVEEDAIIGGNCGLYGSIVIGRQSSVYAGTVLRSASGVYNAQTQDWLRPDVNGTLTLPAESKVEMGLPPAAAFPDAVQRIVPILS